MPSRQEEEVFAAEPETGYMDAKDIRERLAKATRLMKESAKNLDFIQAAQYRDEIARLQALLDKK